MNSFHNVPRANLVLMLEGIRRTQQILNSQAGKDILRAQEILVRSPVLKAAREAQEIVTNSQMFKDILRAQEMLVRSPVLKAAREAQEIVTNSQMFKDILRAQQMLVRSPVLKAAREAQGHDLRGPRLRRVGQTATNWLGRLASRRKVRRPVGSLLRTFAEFIFAKKPFERIYDPRIGDLRFEYSEAVASHRSWKARWVRARGYGSFVATMSAHATASCGHLIVRVWRIFSAAG